MGGIHCGRGGMVRAAACIAVLALAGGAGAEPSFRGLPPLAGEYTWARDVSADGTVIAGSAMRDLHDTSIWEPTWWSRDGTLHLLDNGGYAVSHVEAVSADGMIFAGSAGPTQSRLRPVFWTASGQMVSLGSLGEPGTDVIFSASGVSGNGLVIVGTSNYRGFRWTDAQGMQPITDASGAYFTAAYDVSHDGTVVVGEAYLNEDVCGAARWTAAGGIEFLRDGSGSCLQGPANGVSADGSVVVGSYGLAHGTRAFRWTAAGGVQDLGDLGGTQFWDAAYAVSDDGATVVGYGFSPVTEDAGFIWDAAHGMRALQDVLVGEYGLDLGDYVVAGAYGISGDGQTLVGTGIRTNTWEPWVATLPEPGSLALLALGGVGLLRRRR